MRITAIAFGIVASSCFAFGCSGGGADPGGTGGNSAEGGSDSSAGTGGQGGDDCECAADLACTAHGCLAEQHVNAWVAQADGTGIAGLSAHGWPAPPPDASNVLVMEGNCSVIEPVIGGVAGNMPVALDVGSASIQVNDRMVYQLPPLMDASTFYDGMSLSADGADSFHASVTGGTDVPAATVTFEMAVDVDVVPPAPLTPGATWSLDWSDPSPPAVVEIILDENSRIWCHADGASEVTIPGTITSMLPPPDGNTYAVRLILWGDLEETMFRNGVAFRGQAQRWKDMDVPAGSSQ